MGDSNRQLTAGEQAVLARLRRIYETLPGVTEERDKFGHVALKVGKKTLAMLGLADDRPSLGIKTDLATQAALIKRKDFHKTPYVGQHGWVSTEGTVRQLDWKAIEEILVDTYRGVAPKKLLKEFDDN